MKTRLHTLLSAQQAAELQTAVLHDVLTDAFEANYNRILISFTPKEREQQLIALVKQVSPRNVPPELSDQVWVQFDERFHNAVASGFQKSPMNSIVIIGSDCPFITPEIHDSAIRALQKRNMCIFGWTRDGGVYLIGLSPPATAMFNFKGKFSSGVESWLLIEEAKRLGIEIHSLPELSDVDTEDDLKHAYIMARNLRESGKRFPRHMMSYCDSIGLTVVNESNNRGRKLLVQS